LAGAKIQSSLRDKRRVEAPVTKPNCKRRVEVVRQGGIYVTHIYLGNGEWAVTQGYSPPIIAIYEDCGGGEYLIYYGPVGPEETAKSWTVTTPGAPKYTDTPSSGGTPGSGPNPAGDLVDVVEGLVARNDELLRLATESLQRSGFSSVPTERVEPGVYGNSVLGVYPLRYAQDPPSSDYIRQMLESEGTNIDTIELVPNDQSRASRLIQDYDIVVRMYFDTTTWTYQVFDIEYK
jgi:hypothetical protein